MAPLIALLRLEPNGRMGAQVTAVGRLAAPTHYSSEHNLCTYMLHHESTAKALFAGFRPPLYVILHFGTFVVFERRRHCCPLMPGCPTDFGLQCCAQASHAA